MKPEHTKLFVAQDSSSLVTKSDLSTPLSSKELVPLSSDVVCLAALGEFPSDMPASCFQVLLVFTTVRIRLVANLYQSYVDVVSLHFKGWKLRS